MKEWKRIADWRTAVERAELIFTRWLDAGLLTPLDITRVFNGEYYYYVTFKKTVGSLSPEVYGVITDATSMDEAHLAARAIYGADTIDAVTVEWAFDPKEYAGEFKLSDDGGEKVTLDG